MADQEDSPLDRLWDGYADVFRDFDDLTLARWMAQTLGQLEGRSWRLSHPLVGAYRLAAQIAHDRQIWLKRLATPPRAYLEAPCCRAPLLPLLTRDLGESGLACQHCGATAGSLDDLPAKMQFRLQDWAERYASVHAVAHWDEDKRSREGDYEQAFENAARRAETLLAEAGDTLAPALLDHFPAVVWEDQDECLEVRPEDLELSPR